MFWPLSANASLRITCSGAVSADCPLSVWPIAAFPWLHDYGIYRIDSMSSEISKEENPSLEATQLDPYRYYSWLRGPDDKCPRIELHFKRNSLRSCSAVVLLMASSSSPFMASIEIFKQSNLGSVEGFD